MVASTRQEGIAEGLFYQYKLKFPCCLIKNCAKKMCGELGYSPLNLELEEDE
jgi:hypothetical protein